MQVDIKTTDLDSKSLTLNISGALDRNSLQSDFWKAASAKQKQALNAVSNIIVDLTSIDKADTAGLAWLLNLKRDLHHQQKTVKIVNVPETLLNLAALSSAQALLDE